MRHAGPYPSQAYGGNPALNSHGWEPVPWWHPMRWMWQWHATPMRRWVWHPYSIGGDYDGQWEYKDAQRVARQVLEEQFK